MDITLSTVTTLEDFEFDRLFDASLPRMEAGTMPPWSDDIITDEDKRTFIRNIVTTALAKPDAFCYKVQVDDWTVAVVFGVLNEGRFLGNITLASGDQTGSRSWQYLPDMNEIKYAFYRDYGITEFIGALPQGSPILDNIQARHSPIVYTSAPNPADIIMKYSLD